MVFGVGGGCGVVLRFSVGIGSGILVVFVGTGPCFGSVGSGFIRCLPDVGSGGCVVVVHANGLSGLVAVRKPGSSTSEGPLLVRGA